MHDRHPTLNNTLRDAPIASSTLLVLGASRRHDHSPETCDNHSRCWVGESLRSVRIISSSSPTLDTSTACCSRAVLVLEPLLTSKCSFQVVETVL